MNKPVFPNEEPTAEMRQTAKALRQMYVALVNEGFSKPEALHIVGVAMMGGGKGKDG